MKPTVEVSSPSIEQLVHAAAGNAVVNGLVNRKLEPYESATLRTHLGLQPGAHCARHAFNIGLLSAFRSGVLGVNVVHGPAFLQKNAQVDAALADNMVAAFSSVFSVAVRHVVQKTREQAAGLVKVDDRATFLRSTSTTVLTNGIYQKVFLNGARFANQRNSDESGKLSAQGLAKANAEVVLAGAITAACGQFLNNYSRHVDLVHKQLVWAFKKEGWVGLLSKMLPKTALLCGAFTTSVNHMMASGFRNEIHSPVSDENQKILSKNFVKACQQIESFYVTAQKPQVQNSKKIFKPGRPRRF